MSGKSNAATLKDVNAAIEGLYAAYEEMLAAVSTLHQHQAFQTQIYDTQVKIQNADSAIVHLSDSMRKMQEGIETVVFQDAKPLVDDHCNAVDINLVLKVAKKLSYSTSAPKGWYPGIQIPFPYRPPAPQEESIKKGLLFTSVEALLNALKESRERDSKSDEHLNKDEIEIKNHEEDSNKEKIEMKNQDEDSNKEQTEVRNQDEDSSKEEEMKKLDEDKISGELNSKKRQMKSDDESEENKLASKGRSRTPSALAKRNSSSSVSTRSNRKKAKK